MKKMSYLVLTLLLCFGMIGQSLALTRISETQYRVDKRDTPFGIWGKDWKKQMTTQLGISDPRRLPVGSIVDPNGWLGVSSGWINNTFTTTNITATNFTATTGTITNIVNPSTKLADVTVVTPTSSNWLTNNTFASAFTGWTTTVVGDGSIAVTTTAQDDTSAFACNVVTETGGSTPDCILEQYEAGLTAGRAFSANFWGRLSTTTVTTGTISVILMNSSTIAGSTECWDWTTRSATTTNPSMPDSCNNYITIGTLSTSTYSNFAATSTVFSTGNVLIAFGAFGENGATIMIDNVSVTTDSYSTLVTATPITPDLFTNNSDISLLDADDKICLYQANGGTPACALGFTGIMDLYFNKSGVCFTMNAFTNATTTATCW